MVPHFRDCIEMILDIRSGKSWRLARAGTRLAALQHKVRRALAQATRAVPAAELSHWLQGQSATARTGAGRFLSTRATSTG